MKLTVLGANGRTGRLVVSEALARGMDVTAVVRSQEKVPSSSHSDLSAKVGDPCDAGFLRDVFHGQDVVISTLGGRRPTQEATAIYYRSAQAIVEAAKFSRPKRVLVTSSALVFPAGSFAEKVLKLLVPNVVNSACRMERTLAASELNWTVARCGFLNDKNTNRYRAERDGLPQNGSSVSRLALATFLLDAVDQPKTHFGVFGVSRAEG